jgi:hypothetical protein
METTLEFLTTGKTRREVHRHWPDGVKARIVSESMRPAQQSMKLRSAMDYEPTAFPHGGQWLGRASWSCPHRKMR